MVSQPSQLLTSSPNASQSRVFFIIKKSHPFEPTNEKINVLDPPKVVIFGGRYKC